MRKYLKKKKSAEVKTPARKDVNKETGHDAIEPAEQVTAGSATVQGGSEAQCNSVPEDKEKSSAKKKVHEETKYSESKMIRIKGEWKYEDNLSEEEKREIDLKENRYKRNHVGWKIVEAALVPSDWLSNNESNKLKIIRYVHSKGYKATEIKNRDFGRVELIFDNYNYNYLEANKCLADVQSGANEKIVNFYIPRRAICCKGVINWDRYSSLDELLTV